MTSFPNIARAALLSALFVAPVLCAQQPAPPPPKVDPEAMTALKKMGDYLMTLKTFQVTAAVTTDEVLADSQKIQVAKNIDLIAERPNRLRVQINGDQFERYFFYNGTSFTMWAPILKYYATTNAPSTIGELAKKLEEENGIELPLVDLFRWGTPEAETSAITAAKDLGPSKCEGLTCEHYAFRQNGLDWEVWIQKGDFPLPRKLVLTTTDDDARPQHIAVYQWNLAPSYNDDAFAFTPPDDAKKVPLADIRKAKTPTDR